ncbi:iron (metal) dependent repressor, DtxR family [Corynebacterium mustelae]|uniref:Diphtheria toxin repressor n=1 Tax=Corynebacterium mustelae TaxID=571915 RepID=A0A0G3H0Z7_9CORY|nr:iron (metal) dependent repressor, DtxR family [Corynebacterium mustelae]
MHVMEFPEKTQDYLKCIWDIVERTGEPAALGTIAVSLGQKTPTASEAVKRLVARGLVHHEKYAGVLLTEKGKAVALAMVRRHRLVEMFLVQVLGYSWDEVHEEADRLEHAVSDTFLDRIDRMLGHPTRDPHGDPIPDAQGNIETLSRQALSTVLPGQPVVVEQIHDGDPDFLRYLAQHNIAPGTELIIRTAPVAGVLEVWVDESPVAVSVQAAGDIRVVGLD